MWHARGKDSEMSTIKRTAPKRTLDVNATAAKQRPAIEVNEPRTEYRASERTLRLAQPRTVREKFVATASSVKVWHQASYKTPRPAPSRVVPSTTEEIEIAAVKKSQVPTEKSRTPTEKPSAAAKMSHAPAAVAEVWHLPSYKGTSKPPATKTVSVVAGKSRAPAVRPSAAAAPAEAKRPTRTGDGAAGVAVKYKFSDRILELSRPRVRCNQRD